MTETRTERRARQGKGLSGFMKGYLIYLAVIAIALIAVHFSVRSIMVEYETNSPENYALWLAENARSGELGKYMEEKVFSSGLIDMTQTQEVFYEKCRSAQLEAKRDTTKYSSSNPVLDVTADGKPFLKIELIEENTYTKLGILTLSDWDIASCVLRNESSEALPPVSEDGLLSCTVSYPGDFTLLINNQEANIQGLKVEESQLKEFEYVAPFAPVPTGKTLVLEGLSFEPVISAVNGSGEVIEGVRDAAGNWTVEANYGSSSEAEAKFAEAGLEPLEMARLWSKFMTSDVGGSYRGLYTVRSGCRLLPGTNLYDLATRWAGSIDITFVSNHSIKSWTGEKIENYRIYNDKLMSCDVYLEKNLVLSTGANRTDVFDNRMYFVYVDDPNVATPGWYLADMMSIAGSN